MERYCSTGQSPQRAIGPTEEEEGVSSPVDRNTHSYTHWTSGFGGLEVACWHLVPKFAGSHPAEAVGFLGRKKNPQQVFLRRGSKAVGPMS
jgi:hypothetical protein